MTALRAGTEPDRLRRRLADAGLVLGAAAYGSLRPEVSRRGVARREDVIADVGRRSWHGAVTTLAPAHLEEAMVRVLGFGDLLTRFSVAPLALADRQQDEVARLGSLANLIVTFYDDLVDRSAGFREPLSRAELLRATGRWRPVVNMSPLRPRLPGSRFLVRAVRAYFRHLAALPHTGSRRRIHGTVLRAIVRMHDAERRTVRQGAAAPAVVVRRKAALPFVVMGMPGWLAVDRVNRQDYLWHLRWLYRLGEFFGLVDDIVDQAGDAAAGRANRLGLEGAGRTGEPRGAGSTPTDSWSGAIEERGRLLLEEWQARAPDTCPTVVREAVPLCVGSWLGGPGE